MTQKGVNLISRVSVLVALAAVVCVAFSGCGQAKEALTGTIHDFGGGSVLAPYSSEIWIMEK